MSSRGRFQGIVIATIGLIGASWPGHGAMADGKAETPIVIAEATPADEKPEDSERPPDVSARGPQSDRGASALPIFVPRTNRGAPAARIGGASRGTEAGLLVRALVPEIEGAALTLSEQPALPWHLSQATAHPVNFTLVDLEEAEPLLDVTIPGPFPAGFHRIELAAHSARLEAGRRYYWFVAVVPDPDRRSADIVASGSVERVVEPAPLAAQIAGAPPHKRVFVLAAAGLWYDAFEAIDRRLPDPEAKEQREAMLAEVGIELSSGD